MNLLLSSFNGFLMAYFTLSIVYNASCAISAAQLTTQALGYVFTFGVVVFLDTLFATQFMINKFYSILMEACFRVGLWFWGSFGDRLVSESVCIFNAPR